jgi:hypothetical protein
MTHPFMAMFKPMFKYLVFEIVAPKKKKTLDPKNLGAVFCVFVFRFCDIAKMAIIQRRFSQVWPLEKT